MPGEKTMETGHIPSIETEFCPRLRRSLLLASGVLLLSGLLLGAWFSALAAPDTAPAREPLALFDLAITKSKIPVTFTVGSNNRYILNVSRTNTETVSTLPNVEDVLPVGLRAILPITTVDWDCSTSTTTVVSCVYNKAIPPSLTTFPAIIVSVNVSSTVQQVVTNTARLTTIDGNAANNTASLITVIDSVDLQVGKTVQPVYADVGQPITYTIVITNNGPSIARNVFINETLSTYLTYNISSTSKGVYDPLTGVWNVGTLAKGDIASLILHETSKTTALGQKITNTATATSSNKSDWKTSNNSASATLYVTGLEITKAVNRTEAWVGQDIIFTISVHNAGASDVSNIKVTDVFTSTLDYVRSTPAGGSYSTSTRTFTYNISLLKGHSPATHPNTDTRTITLTFRANKTLKEDRIFKNKAILTIASGVTRTSNEVTVLIRPAIDLGVGKSDGIIEVYPSSTVTYTIVVQNTGSYSVTNVVVTDTLSSNLVFDKLINGTLVMTPTRTSPPPLVHGYEIDGFIAPGGSKSFRVQATMTSSAIVGGTIDNNVTVSSSGTLLDETLATDKNLTNNSVTDTDTIVAEPVTDLEIRLSINPTSGKIGGPFTFRLTVTNAGTTQVNNIKVSDVFPTILDITGATTTRGTVTTNATTRTVSAVIGNMVTGASAQIVITTKINSTATTSATYTHKATMTYDPSKTKYSNEVKYRILGSTLPPTGWGPPQARSPGLAHAALALAALIPGGLGLLALALRGGKRRLPPSARMLKAGIILLVASLTLGCALASFGGGAQGTSPQGQASQEIPFLQRTSQPGKATEKPTQIPGLVTPELPLAAGPTATPTLPAPVESGPTNTPDANFVLPPTTTPTPSRLPDYPIPTPHFYPTLGPEGIPPDSSAVTRIVIPALGLDTVVKFVPYDEAAGTWLIGGLKQEVAWMGNTSWPGLGGNTGLAGHIDLADGSNGPFAGLASLKTGDEVLLYTQKNLFQYQVRTQVEVGEADMSVLQSTQNAQLTLITCTGWDPDLRLYLKRLVVYADLVGVEPL
jgi:LPXTG-site transpeptidase (sortase) family protein